MFAKFSTFSMHYCCPSDKNLPVHLYTFYLSNTLNLVTDDIFGFFYPPTISFSGLIPVISYLKDILHCENMTVAG